jgi:hypothetical protein
MDGCRPNLWEAGSIVDPKRVERAAGVSNEAGRVTGPKVPTAMDLECQLLG